MKYIKILVFLMLLIVGLTAVSAADVISDDEAATSDIQQISSTQTQEEISVESTDNILKTNKNIKEDENTNPVSITTDTTITSENINDYNNKNWTVSNDVTVTASTGVSLSNVAIDVIGNHVTLDGLTISNTDSSNYIINATDKTDLTIQNSVLTITNNQDINTFGVTLKDMSNVLIDDITLNVYAPSKVMEWSSYPDSEYPDEDIYYSVPSVAAISVDSSSNLLIQDSTVNIQNTTEYFPSSTMPAILIRNQTNHITVDNNIITSTGAQYVYGIMTTDGVTEEYITDNTVTVTGQMHVAGIDASTANNSEVKRNTITATSTYVDVPMTIDYDESLAYGIINNAPNNRTVVTGNKICSNTISVTANVTYAIEMYRGASNMICSNSITSNGHMAMGVAVGFTNTTNIVNNYIRTTKTADGFSPFISDIEPTNAGIQLTNQSNENWIQGNDIGVIAVGDNDARTINITNDTDNTVKDNYLWLNKIAGLYNYGSQTVQADSGNDIIGNNNAVVLYQCNCGCMSTTQKSINSMISTPKNAKSDEEEDILIINNENYKNFTNSRDPLSANFPYTFNKANSATGKTIVFAQDFIPNLIMIFDFPGAKKIQEVPLKTQTLGFVTGNWEVDGMYAPNAIITTQTSLKLTNSVAKSIIFFYANDNQISNNIFIGGDYIGSSQDYGDSNSNVTDNYIVCYNNTNIKVGNDAVEYVSGVVENNIPTTQVDYVLNETNYNTLFNEDNTLKDTISGTILVAGNITNPMIITNPVNIITAKSPGKYIYYDGTTSDIEYGITNITFTHGSAGSNITQSIVNNININNNQISITDSNITGKITVNTATTTKIQNNNIIGNEAGIELLNSETALIENNTIETNNTYTITVDADSLENTIKDNILIASQLKGDNSIDNNAEDTVISNNGPLPDPELIINTTNFTAGTTATITATIYRGENIMDVNKGKVVFKVNGKTLKDANGKVLYAKVVNGTATIEDYKIPSSWTNSTITATYSGSTECDKLISDATEITVNESTPVFTTEDITSPKASNITLTANITDGDKIINTGKVVFKINGKTLKDTNGKVIYANVVNGTATVTDYTLPANFKAGNYTITAAYTSTIYKKLETSSMLTITE